MSNILDKLKQAEAQRQRILAGRGAGEARAAPKTAQTAAVPAFIVAIPVEEIAVKEALERAQTETAARLAEQRRHADEKAASMAEERREAEARIEREAKLRAAQPEVSGKSYWLVAGAIAVAGIFAALGFYGTTGKDPGETGAIFQLKLDRDLESFAQRLKEN